MFNSIKLSLAACLLSFGAVGLSAQTDEGLVLHYDFKDVDGTSVTDRSESGVTAKMMSGAKATSIGKYGAIDLGAKNGYLDMTSKAGKVVKALGDHTISCYYLIDETTDITGAGNFVWSFSTSTATTQTAGAYSAYRVNVQRHATAPAGWGSEVGFEVGSPSVKGKWVHVLYRQAGAKGELFIDGKSVASATNMPVLSKNFATAPANCFIGKPAFSSDNYLKNTLVADFRVYGKALTDSEVKELANITSDIDNEYRYGEAGDFSVLKAKIEEIKEFTSTADTNYAVNAVEELMDEVRLATLEVEKGVLTQVFIDKRVAQLNTAYQNCIRTKGFKMLEVPVFPQGEHGFIHPGGMHTNEDFERIKQLLAEGDPTITAAWNMLCANEYSSSAVETWPTWEIQRSGTGDNYMNVARGAAMAYQNALRWKIAGTEANAKNGVRILMKWARENDHVAGNTNASLAYGLYGYALAQAAELLRDYPGWAPEDFEEFKRYIKRTWYGGTMDFLRRRHDTWANWGNSHGERPGHYWSNWGLCCALATMSYGVLLDDVHIYNQGMSFFKYDHVGTWQNCVNKRDNIVNWGCNEYVGNLVVCLHDDERGPFGKLGQMQECGRDQGHANMALGLALDICQQGLSQGDDLFAYMDDRMAAGIEWMAAYNFGNVNNLPWTPYNYSDRNGWVNMGWQMDGPNESSRGQWRPIWWRALGYYEGVRGITPKYTRIAAETVGIDGGGGNYGQTSGGFDHLGFSALTSYRKKISPAMAPTILTGKIKYKGETLNQTDLGGLKYTYVIDGTHAIPADGAEITLMPQLPEGTADTGKWRWDTGETTRDITVKADHSYIYRAHYTNSNGVESVRSFSIAVAGDCESDVMRPEITVDGVITVDTVMNVFYGKSVILYAGNSGYWSNDYYWDNGVTGNNLIVIPNITSDRTYTCQFVNQGGHICETRFHLHVSPCNAIVKVNGKEKDSFTVVANAGDDVSIEVSIPATSVAEDVTWDNGSTGTTFTIEDIQESQSCTSTFIYGGETYTFTYNILVYTKEYPEIAEGYYLVRHRNTNTYMTNDGESETPMFTRLSNNNPSQIWHIATKSQKSGKYTVMSAADSTYLVASGKFSARDLTQPHIFKPVGSDFVALTNTNATPAVWALDGNMHIVLGETVISDYPYELIPADYDPANSILAPEATADARPVGVFDLTGRRIDSASALKAGIYIVNGKKILIK